MALETSGPIWRRWRGTLGAFAVDVTNGHSAGVSNASSPRGPYLLDAAAQGAAVRVYFMSAGIPQSQIGRINTGYVVQRAGPVGVTTPSKTVKLMTTLTRVVNGITVVDSQASAVMTTNGATDWESVFWPPLDGDMVASAMAFAQRLRDPAMHAAFLAQLPGPVVHETGVVIRHSDGSVHATPVAFASFDATVDSFKGAIDRHFDVNGVEFKLPQEQPTGPHYPRAH